MLNGELLLRVADSIERSAKPGAVRYNQEVLLTTSECGTVGCIAGHALVVTDLAKSVEAGLIDEETGFTAGLGKARELLGLTMHQANALFNIKLSEHLIAKAFGLTPAQVRAREDEPDHQWVARLLRTIAGKEATRCE